MKKMRMVPALCLAAALTACGQGGEITAPSERPSYNNTAAPDSLVGTADSPTPIGSGGFTTADSPTPIGSGSFVTISSPTFIGSGS